MTTAPPSYRGSRKHVLDWTGRHDFLTDFADLVALPGLDLSEATFKPHGVDAPDEARLEHFGPQVMPMHPAWPEIQRWWLRRPQGANTPNWDIALTARIEDRPGLVLVEAKANVPEMSQAGKPLAADASENSRLNHDRIGQAIAEAASGWRLQAPDARLDRDSHYQLANRLAFTWKLTTLGIPVVLLYLGFTGDEGIADAGEPIRDDVHWQALFRDHALAVGVSSALERRLDFGAAPSWVLCRSRVVLERSPPRPRSGRQG